MNAPLEPPVVQLPTLTAARVRQRVLDAAHTAPDTRGQRWVPAMAAAVGVASVAATVAVVARPAADVADGADGAAGQPGSTGTALPVDAGPVTGAERDAAVTACWEDYPRRAGADVRYVRRVRNYSTTPAGTSIAVVLRATDGTDLLCSTAGFGIGGPEGQPARTPTGSDPLVPLSGTGGARELGLSPDPGSSVLALPKFYRVHPSIARLESRVVTDGGAVGAWYAAAVADGIAFTRPVVTRPSTRPGTGGADSMPERVEHRAFAADGAEIPLPR